MVAWTVQAYGGVDILVANAGIVKGAEFMEMDEADFDEVLRVNLKGVFLVSTSPCRLLCAFGCATGCPAPPLSQHKACSPQVGWCAR